MVRVKICGITTLDDALAAADAGADALGFVFAKSPRKINPGKAAKIIKALGPWVSTVGVFVNEAPKRILAIARDCALGCVQLHGDEPPEILGSLKGLRIIKSFRVAAAEDLRPTRRYGHCTYLFDTKVSGRFGGTGTCFDWTLLTQAKIARPYILSGGLTPETVSQAVGMLHPYGVDVSSGVEKSPGKKDPKLLKRFIENAKKNIE